MSGCSKIRLKFNEALSSNFKSYDKICDENVDEYSVVYDLRPIEKAKHYFFNRTSVFIKCNEDECHFDIESVLPKNYSSSAGAILSIEGVRCGLFDKHIHGIERHEHLICEGSLHTVVNGLEKLGRYTKREWEGEK